MLFKVFSIDMGIDTCYISFVTLTGVFSINVKNQFLQIM